MTHTTRNTTVGLIASAAIIGSCGGSEGAGSDRAGGQGASEPVVLTMAEPNQGAPPDQIVSWADEVGRRSEGTLRIEFADAWRFGEARFEAGTIQDVQTGKVDMAWVGARVFDTVGVDDFQALVAPLLIDSYDLQHAVFDAGIPDRMLDGLDELGLAGIGVLPGPLRKVLGVTKPFLSPGDFAGAVVGIQDSAVAEDTFAALGATTKTMPSSAALGGLDAYEQQLFSILGNDYWADADYVTTNINLWPRPLVIVMNQGSFEALGTDRQQLLTEATAAAVAKALENSRFEDDESSPLLCRTGIELVTASHDELEALHSALEPVHATLTADPVTKTHLDAITRLKADLDAEPDSSRCEPAGDPAVEVRAPTPIDGVYEVTTTADDLRAGGDSAPIPENYGDWMYVFDRGRFAFTQEQEDACTWGYGTYEVNGDHVSWTFIDGGGIAPNRAENKPGEHFVFGWSLYRDTLTLTAVPGAISPLNFRVKPWQLTTATPAASALNPRCPPPPEALP
jgi:TRAP-type C4-dicarboxylate transport system substrate-binding protein